MKGWLKPQENQVKANWDAALKVEANTTGMGGLHRDSNGEVLVFFCWCLPSKLKHILAEAAALRKAMIICQELNLANVIFEGDCLQVTNADNRAQVNNVELSPIIFLYSFVIVAKPKLAGPILQ